MNITLHRIARQAEEINRATERRAAVANFLKGVLATLAFGAAIYAAIEIPVYVHSRHCAGCDWAWCGKEAK